MRVGHAAQQLPVGQAGQLIPTPQELVENLRIVFQNIFDRLEDLANRIDDMITSMVPADVPANPQAAQHPPQRPVALPGSGNALLRDLQDALLQGRGMPRPVRPLQPHVDILPAGGEPAAPVSSGTRRSPSFVQRWTASLDRVVDFTLGRPETATPFTSNPVAGPSDDNTSDRRAAASPILVPDLAARTPVARLAGDPAPQNEPLIDRLTRWQLGQR